MGEAEEQADGEEIEMKMFNPPLKMGNWLITMKMKEVIKEEECQAGENRLPNGGGLNGLETVSLAVMGLGEQGGGEEAKRIRAGEEGLQLNVGLEKRIRGGVKEQSQVESMGGLEDPRSIISKRMDSKDGEEDPLSRCLLHRLFQNRKINWGFAGMDKNASGAQTVDLHIPGTIKSSKGQLRAWATNSKTREKNQETNYETTSKTWRVNCKGGLGGMMTDISMGEEMGIAIQGM